VVPPPLPRLQLLTLAGEDGLDEVGVGVTSAVEIADHGADIEGHVAVLGGQATTIAVVKEQPARLAGRSRNAGAARVEGTDPANQPIPAAIAA
jgi:hypothetical protein